MIKALKNGVGFAQIAYITRAPFILQIFIYTHFLLWRYTLYIIQYKYVREFDIILYVRRLRTVAEYV